MDDRQTPARGQQDAPLEQMMIEQLRRTHFPEISEELLENIVEIEASGIPLISWEHCVSLISQVSGAKVPTEARIAISRHLDAPTAEHVHDYFEACYLLSGSCAYAINNQPVSLKESDFCLLPPAARHGYELQPNSFAICFAIHPTLFSNASKPFPGESAASRHFLSSLPHIANQEGYLLFHTGDDRTLRIMTLFLFQLAAGTDLSSSRMLNGLMLSFLAQLEAYFCPNGKNAPSHKKTRLFDEELTDIIRQNYSSIRLSDLANQLHYTVPYCSKYIKEHLGCTFSELVRQIRFQVAEEYLAHSSMSVRQISEMVGYENPENFIRAFKKNFGITPTKYRSAHHPSQEHPRS